MARDIIAIAATKSSLNKITNLYNNLVNGSIIAARTYGDEDGDNLADLYAKLADLPYIAADVFPYTEEELKELLGITT